MIRKLGWLDRGMWVLQIIGAEQEWRSDGSTGCLALLPGFSCEPGGRFLVSLEKFWS